MTHVIRHAVWIMAVFGLLVLPGALATSARHETSGIAAAAVSTDGPMETQGISAAALLARSGSEAGGGFTIGRGLGVEEDGVVEVGFDGDGFQESAGAFEDGVTRCHRMPELFRLSDGVFHRARVAYRRDPRTAGLLARIQHAACRFGIDPAIGEGIAWTESRFDEGARSPDGLSVGAFQLTEITAAEMRARLSRGNVDLPLHDEVTLGMGYLRYLSRLFARQAVLAEDGLSTTPVEDPVERWRFAIAAYNAGEGRVAAAQRDAAGLGKNPTRFEDVRPFLPPITRRYVEKVLAFGAAQLALAQSEAT